MARYKFSLDITELEGLDDRQAYEMGFNAGLHLDYRSPNTIDRARSEAVTYGLLAHEKWEKTHDYRFVLFHEFIRGLNRGLRQKELRLVKREGVLAKTQKSH